MKTKHLTTESKKYIFSFFCSIDTDGILLDQPYVTNMHNIT